MAQDDIREWHPASPQATSGRLRDYLEERRRRITEKELVKHARYLADGEVIIAIFGIGGRYFWYSLAAFLPLSFLIIGLPKLLELIHLKHGRTYIFTDRRVLIKDGIFSIKTTSAPYDKITHITVREDFLKKLFYKIGDITVHTAAAGPTPIEIDIVKVENPLEVKNLLEALMTREKNELLYPAALQTQKTG